LPLYTIIFSHTYVDNKKKKHDICTTTTLLQQEHEAAEKTEKQQEQKKNIINIYNTYPLYCPFILLFVIIFNYMYQPDLKNTE
jgi:uncharacterized membrane protein